MSKSYRVKQSVIDLVYSLPKFTPLGWLVVICILAWLLAISMILIG